VPRQPACTIPTAPDGCAMNTGTQSAIVTAAAHGFPVDELVVHLGPSICGRCYEVGVDVYEQLTGWPTRRARNVDLRALLAEQAAQFGVARWSASGECTRCDNDLLFSHRAGDAGRQIAVIYRSNRGN
jgi:copper oxidase (laccase) domain-containing protein